MALSKQENVQVELNTKVCVPSDGFSLARNFCNEIKLFLKNGFVYSRSVSLPNCFNRHIWCSTKIKWRDKHFSWTRKNANTALDRLFVYTMSIENNDRFDSLVKFKRPRKTIRLVYSLSFPSKFKWQLRLSARSSSISLIVDFLFKKCELSKNLASF